jgi:hypothetical protein
VQCDVQRAGANSPVMFCAVRERYAAANSTFSIGVVSLYSLRAISPVNILLENIRTWTCNMIIGSEDQLVG